MTRLDRISQKDAEGSWRAVIETPQGCRHKLKYEPGLGSFSVSSTLPAGMNFRFDFGFIPRTRADDGDPLDILVLMDAPAYPGCLVPVRLLGVIEADQTEADSSIVRNDRLLAVAQGSTERGELRGIRISTTRWSLSSRHSSRPTTNSAARNFASDGFGARRAEALIDAAATSTSDAKRNSH